MFRPETLSCVGIQGTSGTRRLGRRGEGLEATTTGDGGRGSFRSFGEARQAGATGVTTRGWKRGSSVEAVDDDIDITPGVRARGTLLPVDMADICQGHGLAESSSRRWSGVVVVGDGGVWYQRLSFLAS